MPTGCPGQSTRVDSALALDLALVLAHWLPRSSAPRTYDQALVLAHLAAQFSQPRPSASRTIDLALVLARFLYPGHLTGHWYRELYI